MTETQQKTLKLTSDQWGIFGPTFKMDIPVTDIGDGMYEIAKADWNATIGPVFDRMQDNIAGSKKNGQEYHAIANGYNVMVGDQTRSIHELLQAFSVAADPAKLAIYPGTPETNKHLAKMMKFADVFNGPAQSVLVSHSQLQGLANVARGAIEYSREGKRVTDHAKDFYKKLIDDPSTRYSHGLIHAFT